uniref:Putative methyltransferase n=1 Tax=Ixodes ricinus TaxID=34613 RepID=A0A090XAL5_IXORI
MSHVYKTKAHAGIYAKFRPSPPPALIEQIVNFVKEKASPPPGGRRRLRFWPEFRSTCPPLSALPVRNASREADSSVQLVTASQSLLWFDRDKFYAEAERVLVPGGVLAVYAYATPTPVAEDQARLDKRLHDLLNTGAGTKYWSEKRTVDRQPVRGSTSSLGGPCPSELHRRQEGDKTVGPNYVQLQSAAGQASRSFLNEEPARTETLITKLISVLE